ncbi:MAG TPA: hypothetical protein VG474_13865 [Solirubrobacteraceae bacterium]|nr:hypothetical protein [Solirubrobacteraceae bacterium]
MDDVHRPAGRKRLGDLLGHQRRDLAGARQTRAPVADDDDPRIVLADLVLGRPWVERMIALGEAIERRLSDARDPLAVVRAEALGMQDRLDEPDDVRKHAAVARLVDGAALARLVFERGLQQADGRATAEKRRLDLSLTRRRRAGSFLGQRRQHSGRRVGSATPDRVRCPRRALIQGPRDELVAHRADITADLVLV